MGTGIGKNCKRCGNQLTYDAGFNYQETLCNECESIVKFDLMTDEEKKDAVGY